MYLEKRDFSFSRKTILFDSIMFVFMIVLFALLNFDGMLVKVLYYMVCVSGIMIYVCFNYDISYTMIPIMAISILSCLINSIVIGNTSYLSFVILLSGFFIALIVLDDSSTSNPFLFAFLLYSIYIAVMMLLKGIQVSEDELTPPVFFAGFSNNYISVYLIAINCLLYVKRELEHKKIFIWPSGVTTILSILAGGRMGAACAVLLLILLIIMKMDKNKSAKLFLFPILVFAIILSKQIIIRYSSYLRVLSRTNGFGLNDIRFVFIRDYLSLLHNPLYFVFGGDVKQLDYLKKWDYNLHNSYLIVHSKLGLIAFIGMICLIIYCLYFGLREKRGVYLSCFIPFLARCFTDSVIGCNRLTPIMLVFLLYPFIVNKMEEKLCIDN